MGYLADLITARDQIAARLVEATSKLRPDYETNDQEVRWTKYKESLVNDLAKINKAIAAGEVDSEPFEILSRGIT